MKKLKEIADYEQEKLKENYIDASDNKRQAYDNAVNAAKGIINQTQSPTMSSDTINKKRTTLNKLKML